MPHTIFHDENSSTKPLSRPSSPSKLVNGVENALKMKKLVNGVGKHDRNLQASTSSPARNKRKHTVDFDSDDDLEIVGGPQSSPKKQKLGAQSNGIFVSNTRDASLLEARKQLPIWTGIFSPNRLLLS